MTERLHQTPDWPDISKWERDFTSQMLHDWDKPMRDKLLWNKAEDQDLIDQVNADVSSGEIARRHQRTWKGVAGRHQALMWQLQERLLR